MVSWILLVLAVQLDPEHVLQVEHSVEDCAEQPVLSTQVESVR